MMYNPAMNLDIQKGFSALKNSLCTTSKILQVFSRQFTVQEETRPQLSKPSTEYKKSLSVARAISPKIFVTQGLLHSWNKNIRRKIITDLILIASIKLLMLILRIKENRSMINHPNTTAQKTTPSMSSFPGKATLHSLKRKTTVSWLDLDHICAINSK